MANRREEAVNVIKPRRLRTAYAYFVKDHYEVVKKQVGSVRPQPIISRLGEMWRNLQQNDRDRYIAREAKDRNRYTQAKQEWARQHAGRPMSYLNKKKKELNSPMRPRPPFIFFRQEMSKKLREEMPEAVARARDREICNRWRKLDETGRVRFKKMADDDRLRYAKEMQDHRSKVIAAAKAEQERRLEQLQQRNPENAQNQARPVVGPVERIRCLLVE